MNINYINNRKAFWWTNLKANMQRHIRIIISIILEE